MVDTKLAGDKRIEEQLNKKYEAFVKFEKKIEELSETSETEQQTLNLKKTLGSVAKDNEGEERDTDEEMEENLNNKNKIFWYSLTLLITYS